MTCPLPHAIKFEQEYKKKSFRLSAHFVEDDLPILQNPGCTCLLLPLKFASPQSSSLFSAWMSLWKFPTGERPSFQCCTKSVSRYYSNYFAQIHLLKLKTQDWMNVSSYNEVPPTLVICHICRLRAANRDHSCRGHRHYTCGIILGQTKVSVTSSHPAPFHRWE